LTAREEPGTEATTGMSRRATSEEPSVANPIKPKRLQAREQGRHVKDKTTLSGLHRMTEVTRREGDSDKREETVDITAR